MELLAGPRAKLERAREHVESLTAEFRAWSVAIQVETLVDHQRHQLIVRAVQVPDLPLRWSTILGDALHNYRGVLDHLVWQLAWKNLPEGAQPPNTTQFPIVSDRANWEDQAFRVAALSDRHRDMVEQLQPYRRGFWLGAGPPRNPLEDLRDLSNVDKHRFVVVTTYGAGERASVQLQSARGISFGQVYYLVGLPVVVGTELLKVHVTDLPDPTDYEVALLYEPSTYFALAGGPQVERVLEEIDQTVETILRFFAAEPLLLSWTRPELQTPDEREQVSLLSLRARLPVIRERLEHMGRGLGVEMPDPYGPLRPYFDDLQGLWGSEFRACVRENGIVELAELAFSCRSELEEHGLIEHRIEGLPALERTEAYPELIMRLELAVGLLELAIHERVEALGGLS